MRKIAILAGIGVATLLAAPSADAASDAGKSRAKTEQAKVDLSQATDVSARRRYYRHYRQVYRPYYSRSYAYAPRPYYSQPYYSSGPSVSFSFGGGGYRNGYGGWGHRW